MSSTSDGQTFHVQTLVRRNGTSTTRIVRSTPETHVVQRASYQHQPPFASFVLQMCKNPLRQSNVASHLRLQYGDCARARGNFDRASFSNQTRSNSSLTALAMPPSRAAFLGTRCVTLSGAWSMFVATTGSSERCCTGSVCMGASSSGTSLCATSLGAATDSGSLTAEVLSCCCLLR